MATIIIKRKSSFAGGMQNHNVYILNTFIGELKNGGTIMTTADVGTHFFSFNSTMKKLGKNATFHVVVNDPDEIVELITYFDVNGNYVVKYNDTAPHIPVGSNTARNDNRNNAESNFNDSPDTADTTNTTNTINTRNNTQTTSFSCPRCHSNDITPITEVSTKGKDFKADNACCGFLLCGPLGLLFGATGKGKQTITTTYWMCRGCGNKFKSE